MKQLFIFEIFKDHIESQVTDQESTIEMWNCSFDEKIDSALESHVTYSILKIRKLAETFKSKLKVSNIYFEFFKIFN